MKRANVKAIVEAYGGVTAFAKECEVTNQTVYQWIWRNSMARARAELMANMYAIDRDLLHDPWEENSEMMTEEETRELLGLEKIGE